MKRIVLLVTAVLMAAGCDSDSPTAPSPTPDPAPMAATFSDVQSQVFNTSCVSHHGAVATAGLDLRAPQSYTNLVNVVSPSSGLPFVAPSNPEGSYLVHKLDGRASIVGGQMPLGGTPLSADLINLVRDWIQAGALNN